MAVWEMIWAWHECWVVGVMENIVRNVREAGCRERGGIYSVCLCGGGEG